MASGTFHNSSCWNLSINTVYICVPLSLSRYCYLTPAGELGKRPCFTNFTHSVFMQCARNIYILGSRYPVFAAIKDAEGWKAVTVPEKPLTLNTVYHINTHTQARKHTEQYYKCDRIINIHFIYLFIAYETLVLFTFCNVCHFRQEKKKQGKNPFIIDSKHANAEDRLYFILYTHLPWQ